MPASAAVMAKTTVLSRISAEVTGARATAVSSAVTVAASASAGSVEVACTGWVSVAS
ncbi:MAG: hypothetical protein WKF82_02820 [Nocardioidaceae bacterium]